MSPRPIAVGDPLFPNRSLPEGVAADAAQVWTVIVSVLAPSAAEVEAVARGELTVGWLRVGPVLLVSALAGDLSGTSAWTPADRTAPETLSDDGGCHVAVLLVDARTTVVQAMRTIGLSASQAARLRELEASAADTWATMPAAQREASVEAERAFAAEASPEAVAALLEAEQDAIAVRVTRRASGSA